MYYTLKTVTAALRRTEDGLNTLLIQRRSKYNIIIDM